MQNEIIETISAESLFANPNSAILLRIHECCEIIQLDPDLSNLSMPEKWVEIEEISPLSPAAIAGLQIGDSLISLNDKDLPEMLDLESLDSPFPITMFVEKKSLEISDIDLQSIRIYKWTFNSQSRGIIQLQLKAGMCPGIRCQLSKAAALARIKSIIPNDKIDFNLLLRLCQLELWPQIKEICQIKNFDLNDSNDIISLFFAIACWEQKLYDICANYFTKYIENASNQSTKFMCLGYYYHALETERIGCSVDETLNILEKAMVLDDTNIRVRNAILQRGGEVQFYSERLNGALFPIYNFPVLACSSRGIPATAGKLLNIKEALDKMFPHQVLLVCLLTSNRANEWYHLFLRRYNFFIHWFPSFFFDCHIVTSTSISSEKDALCLNLEAEILKSNSIPLKVLFDANDELNLAVEQLYVPEVFVINKKGKVIMSGDEKINFWKILYEITLTLKQIAKDCQS
eukprot:TRINITY_DN2197_c0_g4_i1.p1 TRINITY_DN2197_c0_g4~~TRINITY_DN2197_c0_g4_i1.p1  ORF type:complete len:518 (-),score=212.13 TRINITY_DN2197_c0_g4_i1:59-1438(-)